MGTLASLQNLINNFASKFSFTWPLYMCFSFERLALSLLQQASLLFHTSIHSSTHMDTWCCIYLVDEGEKQYQYPDLITAMHGLVYMKTQHTEQFEGGTAHADRVLTVLSLFRKLTSSGPDRYTLPLPFFYRIVYSQGPCVQCLCACCHVCFSLHSRSSWWARVKSADGEKQTGRDPPTLRPQMHSPYIGTYTVKYTVAASCTQLVHEYVR
jgi:hypothetical protein